ncbi:hypothetical protein VTK56DRAFT_411 [Thermocarpiscus australiensis]
MVSQRSDGSTSLTLRGPASVVGAGDGSSGRSSSGLHVSSRSRRYNRSHAGGSAYAPQNEFPVFSHSGDVEIIVRVPTGHENRYLLHRHTLTRCSGFFEASTSNEWSRAQPVPELPAPGTAGAIEAKPASGGELARIDDRGGSSDGSSRSHPMTLAQAKKRWRYELDYGTGGNDIPMLVQKDESSSSNPPPVASSIFGGAAPSHSPSRHHHRKSSSHSFFRSVANLSLSATHVPSLPPPTPEEQDLLRDYDNLFRIMYNYPPCLDSVNIADAYVQCKSLLALADQYDALAVVGPRVDHHLLQFQSRLWRMIAKYPISYLRLGYLARSKVIFQEALIHVVGQWPAGERSIRAALPEAVVDLIEDKVDELEEAVSRVEARLFRLTLTTRSGERVSPATNYIDWLAVSLFRQWLADNTTPPPMPAPPGAADRSTNRTTRGDAGSRRRGTSTSSASGASTSTAAHHPPPSSRSGSSRHGTSHSITTTTATTTPSSSWSSSSSPSITPLASLGRTYRLLGSGSEKESYYLGHDECKRFLKLTPELYSRDNLRRFERRIGELKAMAREVVRPLMGSGLELEVRGTSSASSSSSYGSGAGAGGTGGIAYLTCTTVRDADLPWAVER